MNLENLLKAHKTCAAGSEDQQFYETQIIQRHFIERIQELAESLGQDDSDLDERVGALIEDTKLLNDYFSSG